MDNIVKLIPRKEVNLVKTADDTLEQSKGILDEVLILGYNEDGVLYINSNANDKRSMLFLIEDFKFSLLAGNFDEE
jgi:hypothetical protein